MIRPILKYGDRPLHGAAAPVAQFDAALHQLLRDMAETMYAAPGIGLAAPQIGVPLRAFVIDLSVAKEPGRLIEMINPVMVSCDGIQLEEEGCLSCPASTRRCRVRPAPWCADRIGTVSRSRWRPRGRPIPPPR